MAPAAGISDWVIAVVLMLLTMTFCYAVLKRRQQQQHTESGSHETSCRTFKGAETNETHNMLSLEGCRVVQLWRFAVKGLDYDELDTVRLRPKEGFPCDRRWALWYTSSIHDEQDQGKLSTEPPLPKAPHQTQACLVVRSIPTG